MEIDHNEIITNVATDIIKSSINYGWEKVKGYFKDFESELDIEYRTAYTEYIRNTKDRLSKIKTIIYRRERKDLYSFYESTEVSLSGDRIKVSDINNLLNIDRKIIVTGTGGIGKSILFKHLFLNAIDKTNYIPVFIELRSINTLDNKEIVLADLVYNNLCINGFKLERKYFDITLERGAYIIFLDGFDEIHYNKKEVVTKQIKKFSTLYLENCIFVSSRPSAEFISWEDFSEVESLPLTKQQALSLINKIDFDENVKKTFSYELDRILFEKYESFASNPLLLNIMLLTFQKHASIPERLNDFYEEAFITLFNVHDATKDSFVRDIRSGLGCEDFKLVFSYICFKSYFNGEYEFSETRLRELINLSKEKFKDKFNFNIDDFQEDLVHSVCMLVKEGLEYRFSHRSFQEYFAAWYTCKLPDVTQEKLLNNWIKERNGFESENYFKMLYDLQSEKVNTVILREPISEISKKYEELGYSVTLLKEYFFGFSFSKDNSTDTIIQRLSINSNYSTKAFYIVQMINNIDYQSRYTLSDNEYKKYKELAKGKFSISIEEGVNLFGEEKFLEIFSWIEDYFKQIKVLNENSKSNVTKKRKVSSILEEL